MVISSKNAKIRMESVKYVNLSHFEMLYVLIESSMYFILLKLQVSEITKLR